MIVNPKSGTQYTLTQLVKWFFEAREKGETLEIYPCNPMDVPLLWTRATVNSTDDITCLTQWLNGVPE